MGRQYKIHEADAAQLVKIRRYLIGYRKTNGWTQPQLSQLVNGTDGMAWELESNETWQWRFSRLQDWMTPFNLRLTAVLRFPDDPDLEARVHAHPEVAPAFALSCNNASWKHWQRLYLTSALSVARKELDISSETMGKFLGVSYKAVWNWENTANEAMLCKILQYARLLDGYVQLGYEELL